MKLQVRLSIITLQSALKKKKKLEVEHSQEHCVLYWNHKLSTSFCMRKHGT